MPNKRGVQGKPLTPEENDECTRLLKEGLTWKEIALKLKRPEHSIYYHYKNANPDYIPRRTSGKRPMKEVSYEDLSNLPNDTLFNWKMFPLF